MAEMSEEQRIELGEAVRQARVEQFETKKDAYSAAGLNSATWDRIEAGMNVREHRLIPAIKLLWPASSGSWERALEQSRTGVVQMTYGGMNDWSTSIEKRIGSLEQQVKQLLKGQERGTTSPMNRAEGSSAQEVWTRAARTGEKDEPPSAGEESQDPDDYDGT